MNMKLNKLKKSVLGLWYIRATIASLALVSIFAGTAVILNAAEASG